MKKIAKLSQKSSLLAINKKKRTIPTEPEPHIERIPE